jgi:hypothetical protein
MAKKTSKKRSARKNVTLGSLERLVRTGFQQVDKRFTQVDKRFAQVDKRFAQIDRRFVGLDLELRDLKREVVENHVAVNERIDNLATHVDGFMKLHETLDIEFRVMKEQINRLEERLKRLEATGTS